MHDETKSPAGSGGAPLLGRLPGGALQLKLAPGLYFGSVSPQWTIDARLFSDHDLFYCLEGEADFTCDAETVRLKPGDAYLVRAGATLSARHTSCGHFRVFAQHFDLLLWDREDLLALMDWSPLAPLPHRVMHEAAITRMTELASAGDCGVLRHAMFLPLVLDFLGAAWRGDRAVSAEARVLQSVEESLRRHLAEADALERALAFATWEPAYTARLFARSFGLTPKQYLIQLRLARAREMLETGMAVKEVARACGFSDELYFSRLFKNKTGHPPTAHRSLW